MTGSLRSSLAFLLALPPLLCGPVLAQAPSAATFFQRPAVLEAKLSPSGKRLAFSTSLGGEHISVVVLDLADGMKSYHPANFKDSDVTRFDWVSDDRLVFSLYNLRDVGHEVGERAPGLISVRFDGQERRTLVRTEGLTSFYGRIRGLTWNHTLLAVPKAQPGVEPDRVIVGRETFSRHDLIGLEPVWLNVSDGDWKRLDTGSNTPARVLQWWFDSVGHPRAAYTQSQGRGAFYWHGPEDAAWRRIAEGDANEMPFFVDSVDDVGHLYVTAPQGEAGTQVLSLFDFETMAPGKALVAVPGFDFSGTLLSGKPGAGALGVRVNADAETTVWFDPRLQALQQEIDTRLPGLINRISCQRCGEPDMVALVRSYSDREPGMLWLYEAAGKKLQPIMKVMSGLDSRNMSKVDFQRIKARDGRDLPLWLTLPHGVKPGEAAPAVVMVHGGPWARGGRWAWDAMNQFLAAQGWLVIEPEFRGSTGYGGDHYRAGFKQWGRSMEDDLADALLWAQSKGLAKPGKACIAGASYGGYAALMGPVRYPDLFGCVAAWAGVTDLELFLEGNVWTADDISGQSRQYDLPKLVGDTQKDAALLRTINPLLLADRMKAPVLLVYGEADQRVPLAHGKRMRDALTAAGNPPEWFTYPNEGHGWSNPDNQIDFAERLAAFFSKHLH